MTKHLLAHKLILTFLAVVLVCAHVSAKPVEHYIRFQISDHQELQTITRVVSISNVEGNTVYAYANDKELRKFEELGYAYEHLPHPSSGIVPDMAESLMALEDWDTYPSFEQYDSIMNRFAADYPALCQIYNAGYSVEGRKILFVKISDNVNVAEDEPEVMYTSSIHGDETTGYILMLRLIDSLLSAYGSDPEITNLVNNLEIWINPLANPDGTYATGNSSVAGATRYNANGVDLNRNFPDPDNGPHPDGNEWQPETIVMMDFAAAHNFVISANFHGGAEVVNYPWDTWSRLHVDDVWYYYISRCYADTVHEYSIAGYMDDLEDGVTNGYDWYPVAGGRQDFMNYWHHCRETTIELSKVKLVEASNLPTYWAYNRVSLFDYLENALWGIRGVVTDNVTGQPLSACVTVIGHDLAQDSSQVYSDPVTGNYHRMIESGVYDIEFSAENYIPDTVFGVVVSVDDITVVDVQLVRSISFVCGDVNGEDGRVDLRDIDYLIAYFYRFGPAPPVLEAADVNSSGRVDILDVSYLIDYLFLSGPEPVCL